MFEEGREIESVNLEVVATEFRWQVFGTLLSCLTDFSRASRMQSTSPFDSLQPTGRCIVSSTIILSARMCGLVISSI